MTPTTMVLVKPRRSGRLLVTCLGGVGWGVVVAGIAALLLPFLFHARSFVVMSGSMEPTIHTGDVVIVQRVRAASMRVGDIVTFRDPDGSGRLITHRVRSIQRDGRSVRVVTKGDAANGVQRWSTAADGSVGRVRYRLPKLGYLIVNAQTPFVRMLLVLVPTLVLAGLALGRIWQRQPGEA